MSDATVVVTATEARFGEGEFPADLDRVNFGAALVGALWALVHGCWLWLLLFVAIRAGSAGLFGYLQAHQLDGSKGLVLTATLVVSVIEWTVSVVFGTKANRLAWAYEANRIASGRPDSSAYALSVERFERNQRVWLYGGAVWLIAGTVLPLVQSGGMQWPFERALIFGGCAAIALVALWLLDGGRKRPLGSS